VGNVYVAGRCDGLTDQGWVLEVKQRRSRLFHRVPVYEKVQCEVYCRMYDAPGAIHVERLTENDNKTTRLPRDDKLWHDICQALELFEQRYAELQNMDSEERAKFIIDVSVSDGPLQI